MIEYSGIRSSTVGNMLLHRKILISTLRPTKSYLENAYAAIVATTSVSNVVHTATRRLFFIADRKSTVLVNSFLYASKVGCAVQYVTTFPYSSFSGLIDVRNVQ